MTAQEVCRSCGSDALDDLGPCTPPGLRTGSFGHYDPGRLRQCRDCGLAQRQPIPDEQTLIDMYRQTSVEEWTYQYQNNAAWSLARKRLRSRFDDDRELLVLDVGCHTGSFLSGLPEVWKKYGIESAREPAGIASEQHDVSVIGERLEAIGDEWEGHFDAVTMFDVVEHLSNPAAGIAQAARLLKPGGIFMLSTGDFDAWTWRWLGGGHWYLQTPQHLSIVSRRFLTHVADRCSLRLNETRSIPHRHAPWHERQSDTIKAIYWGLRCRRGIYRVPHRILQSLPGLGYLRHLQSVPWTMSLTDHFLATFERQSNVMPKAFKSARERVVF